MKNFSLLTEVTTDSNEKSLVTLLFNLGIEDISKMSLFELENYVIPFGKHRGKTLKEVKPTGYLDWVLKQVDFNNKETQDIIKLYYKKLEEPVVTKTDNNINQDEIDNLPF